VRLLPRPRLHLVRATRSRLPMEHEHASASAPESALADREPQ
jgi:hypothetical protein